MFLDIRMSGKKKKFYLIHTYRLGGKVQRISRYLGTDLKEPILSKLRAQAKKHIQEQMRQRTFPVSRYQRHHKRIQEIRPKGAHQTHGMGALH